MADTPNDDFTGPQGRNPKTSRPEDIYWTDDDAHVDEKIRLSRDLVNASRSMGPEEARYLVDAYYMTQENRKRTDNQVRALKEEPHFLIGWLAEKNRTLEHQIARALDAYTQAHPMGDWMRDIVGIGPVISAGLLAHIDMDHCPTVGHIWQFAGIAGSGQKPWERGQKRPFNATLKVICWKVGQSFMKLSNRKDCFYGQIYRERKAYEIANNEAGRLAEQAAKSLPHFKKTTEAYKWYEKGQLPPAHIDARARRYAVKLFLSHLHSEWHERHFGKPAPLPYPIAFMGHAHIVNPPPRPSQAQSQAAQDNEPQPQEKKRGRPRKTA